ncbi:hypothetical protein MPER_04299, partial [Moniliophthora perniciosa FA553]
ARQRPPNNAKKNCNSPMEQLPPHVNEIQIRENLSRCKTKYPSFLKEQRVVTPTSLTKKKAQSVHIGAAYAPARHPSSLRMTNVIKFLNAPRAAYGTNVRLINDVLYSPYSYQGPSIDDAPNSGSHVGHEMRTVKKKSKFEASSNEAEIFLFEYGTVVIWGMSEAQEKRFLSSLKRFEVEKLAPEDVEMEDLNYYYANYSRIYNDVITLRKGSSYMRGLSLSHALSQSVKISLFEKLISNTIEETKDIPEIIRETGKIGMPHKGAVETVSPIMMASQPDNKKKSCNKLANYSYSEPTSTPLVPF